MLNFFFISLLKHYRLSSSSTRKQDLLRNYPMNSPWRFFFRKSSTHSWRIYPESLWNYRKIRKYENCLWSFSSAISFHKNFIRKIASNSSRDSIRNSFEHRFQKFSRFFLKPLIFLFLANDWKYVYDGFLHKFFQGLFTAKTSADSFRHYSRNSFM